MKKLLLITSIITLMLISAVSAENLLLQESVGVDVTTWGFVTPPGGVRQVGQNFSFHNNTEISQLNIYIQSSSGSPVGQFIIGITTDYFNTTQNQSVPSTTYVNPNATINETFGFFNKTNDWNNITLAENISLSGNTTYWFWIGYEGTDGGTNRILPELNSGDPISEFGTAILNGAWTISSSDLGFGIIGENQAAAPNTAPSSEGIVIPVNNSLVVGELGSVLINASTDPENDTLVYNYTLYDRDNLSLISDLLLNTALTSFTSTFNTTGNYSLNVTTCDQAPLCVQESAVFELRCQENWVENNTECLGGEFTKIYLDENACGTSANLPGDNGTTNSCIVGYVAVYTTSDAAPAAIDIVVGIIVVFAIFSTLIGLVMVVRWFFKNTNVRGNKR